MRYVKMDEIWIHHYTPESNRQSAEWTAKGEIRLKQPKTQMSAGKVLSSVSEEVFEEKKCPFTKTMHRITIRS